MRKILITVSILIGLSIIAFIAMVALTRYCWITLPHKQLMSGAKVGWSQAQVIEHLGEPKWVMRSTDEVLILFHGGGLKPLTIYPIENKVLVYEKMPWYLFVYVDDAGRVTHVVDRRT